MPDTAETVWRRVLLHVPGAPVGLALTWVQMAYNRLCDRRRHWSFLRGETTISLQAARSGTCTVAQGDATVVTGAGTLTLSAADVGRQFRVDARGIPYTIASLNGANSVELDRPYEGTSATAAAGQVLDAYWTAPADFGGWLAVIDPYDSRPDGLALDVEERELNHWDPARQVAGTPTCVVSRRLSTVAATLGQVTYEVHPYWTGSTVRSYPGYYWKRPGELTDDTVLRGPLQFRTDILLEGALARAAGWPGTAEQRNPYFDLRLAQKHQEIFEYETALLEAADEEVYLTWLETIGLHEKDWAHPAVLGGDLRDTE